MEKVQTETIDIYMIATGFNKKDKPVQAAVLKNLIGDEAVEKFETFVYTELNNEGEEVELDKNDPNVLIKKMDEYLNPLKNTTYERYQFFTRKQEQGENFDSFLTALKTKSNDCEFGPMHKWTNNLEILKSKNQKHHCQRSNIIIYSVTIHKI